MKIPHNILERVWREDPSWKKYTFTILFFQAEEYYKALRENLEMVDVAEPWGK